MLGLTRDWEVILDRWPLDVFCFCFTLKVSEESLRLRRAVWLLPCKESWEIRAGLLSLVGVFFSWIVKWRRMAGKKVMCVFKKKGYRGGLWQTGEPFTCGDSRVWTPQLTSSLYDSTIGSKCTAWFIYFSWLPCWFVFFYCCVSGIYFCPGPLLHTQRFIAWLLIQHLSWY